MGRREVGQGQFFYSFDLDKVVPPDHLVRQVERARPELGSQGACALLIDMITTALDIGIMTSIVMLVAFGLALRRNAPRRGSHHDSPYRVYEDTP